MSSQSPLSFPLEPDIASFFFFWLNSPGWSRWLDMRNHFGSLPPRAIVRLKGEGGGVGSGGRSHKVSVAAPGRYSPVRTRRCPRPATYRPRPGPADENHYMGPSQIPGRAEATGMLNGKTPFPVSKQIHSSIVLPGCCQIPPAEPDFPPTFFFNY